MVKKGYLIQRKANRDHWLILNLIGGVSGLPTHVEIEKMLPQELLTPTMPKHFPEYAGKLVKIISLEDLEKDYEILGDENESEEK
jgi:hypothetical protein